MYIILCGRQGTGKSAVADSLKDYYSYRGTACYTYDFMQPIQEAHDAVFISLQQYETPRPAEGLYHRKIFQSLYDALDKLLPTYTDKNVQPVIQKWDELKLFHMTVVHGMATRDQLARYPAAFKVLLTCDTDERYKRISSLGGCGSVFCVRDYHHEIEKGFDYCLDDGTFNLIINTEDKAPKDIADQIGEAIHEKLFGVTYE